jgi:hypothetical protein
VKRRVTRRLDRHQFLKCGAAINHFSILRGFPHAFDLNKSRVILTAVNTPCACSY